uniref:Methyltransferase domain-containing protein n=1 Tax=Pseudo-nitzschia australis TaxID=44445 RepID=A0A7S4AWP5_9STRA|mmetsp:Transcript_24505/g.51778  ORF Transcript_24505/g.51778 Transcript_24505/m.51778 type:complete len:489 (-) Transcript_24505:109-1575(-)
MPKRDRITDEKDEDADAKRANPNTATNEEDEEHFDEEDEEEEYDDETGEQEQCFVAWLEEGATCLSVGELHFDFDHRSTTNNDSTTTNSSKDNSYCVVCKLHLLPPEEDVEDDGEEESPLLFSFDGSDAFPFTVLPSSACVAIELDSLLPDIPLTNGGDDTGGEKNEDNDDNDDASVVVKTFALNADLHQSMLEELNSSCGESEYTKVSPNLQSTLTTTGSMCTDKAAVDGVNAWWKAGEGKTGWDLSKIPQGDFTTLETLGSGSDDEIDNNTLLHLYKDLCAFRPLTSKDDRDAIEERFEWRTCLCTYFAWAVPNQKAISLLVNRKQPLLEIGAGTGYWAWLLSQHNVDVVAYDLPDSHAGQKHRFRHSIVRDGSVEQAYSSEHKGRALFLCWPDIVGDSAQDDADRGSFGVDALKAYQGDTIVHVGELGPGVVRAQKGWGDPFPPGGSSSSAAFQEELALTFELKERVELPNWPPYNSHLTVWVRK